MIRNWIWFVVILVLQYKPRAEDIDMDLTGWKFGTEDI